MAFYYNGTVWTDVHICFHWVWAMRLMRHKSDGLARLLLFVKCGSWIACFRGWIMLIISHNRHSKWTMLIIYVHRTTQTQRIFVRLKISSVNYITTLNLLKCFGKVQPSVSFYRCKSYLLRSILVHQKKRTMYYYMHKYLYIFWTLF